MAAGQNISFGLGVDHITDFDTGTDKLDVAQAGTGPTTLIGFDSAADGAVGVTYVVYGAFSAGTFVAAAGFDQLTAHDALVVQGDGATAMNDAGNSGWVLVTGIFSALTSVDFI